MNLDRVNRAALLVVGLLLLAAGVTGALAYTDALQWALPGRALADNPVSRYAGANGRWFWPLVCLAALVVLLLALRWLAALLLTTDQVRTLELPGSAQAGEQTTVAGPALEAAVRDQIEGYRGVTSARVHLTGRPQQPVMKVDVDTSELGELPALCRRIEHGALADARRALGRPDLPIRLDLDARRAPTRVR
ncbi:hypothetical protein CS0771_64300 [Catellatospora sp. IY07-71]|uniref:alkaline shock response membrane anchor protein AmaP n=1 Tax=Catellatospora sp. IY07-71 TaxID=2728827 RepID=UPI001BB44148|nr:alkaline shock response membrane anchor protein AmaP [Catellatospora sp. IY07-71]BCJ76886.1 hypothetical protein CS0771_64300 [Catellatospora sp. IY07-71]